MSRVSKLLEDARLMGYDIGTTVCEKTMNPILIFKSVYYEKRFSINMSDYIDYDSGKDVKSFTQLYSELVSNSRNYKIDKIIKNG
jgi:hypothetical protein